MEDFEEKLGAILGNPQMMQQIMSMAQALGQSPVPPQPEPQAAPPAPEFDLAALQKLSGLASQGSIDKNQRALLAALTPYLSRERLSKLEKAMRAAKMAQVASGFLGQGGLQILGGR